MIKRDSKELKDLQDEYSNTTITHWVKNIGVNCHIFTIQIDNVKQLKSVWESIADKIAVYFQADFKNEYESWNVYVIFLSVEKIPRDLKFRIENDKYSSRKIVLDEIPASIKESEIIGRISKRIFELDVGENEVRDDFQQDLSQIIDQKLYTLISGIDLDGQTEPVQKRKERIFNKLLEEYSHEI